MPITKTTKRNDLIGRGLVDRQTAATRRTIVQDPRVERIKEKILDYLDVTPVEEWNPQIAGFFKELWKDKKQEIVGDDENSQVSLMSSEERRKLITGDQ